MKIPYNPKLIQIARDLRKNPTVYEMKIWNYLLRDKQMSGYKFTRQKPILNFIVDFYCAKLLMVVEIDGEVHDYKISYDNSRAVKINQLNIKIIRIKNKEIELNIDKIREKLVIEIQKREIEILTNPLKSPLAGGK